MAGAQHALSRLCGASRKASAPTNTDFIRAGSATEAKNGAKATIPLSRTRASVIALRKWVQSLMGVLLSA
jgi:hypothetical protein